MHTERSKFRRTERHRVRARTTPSSAHAFRGWMPSLYDHVLKRPCLSSQRGLALVLCGHGRLQRPDLSMSACAAARGLPSWLFYLTTTPSPVALHNDMNCICCSHCTCCIVFANLSCCTNLPQMSGHIISVFVLDSTLLCKLTSRACQRCLINVLVPL